MAQQPPLHANMYVGGPFGKPSTRFGLVNGQVRNEHLVVRDALWYNLEGEFLGGGDLARDDFYSIFRGLERGEFFIVCEAPSAWQSREDGINLVRQRCRFIIRWDQLFLVEEKGVFPAGTKRVIGGVPFQVARRRDTYRILTIM